MNGVEYHAAPFARRQTRRELLGCVHNLYRLRALTDRLFARKSAQIELAAFLLWPLVDGYDEIS